MTSLALMALVLGDRALWTDDELAREVGGPRHLFDDALADLRAAGLVHVVETAPRLVFASRAAVVAERLEDPGADDA